MVAQLTFPPNPGVSDIFRARVFQEPLVPVGADPTPEENAALAAALVDYSACSDPDDFSRITEFLDSYPASGWSVALLTNLGMAYYGLGYYSKALEAWTRACHLAMPITDPSQKPLADRAIGELASMLARLGRTAALHELLRSVEGRIFCGPAIERITGARGGLANMQAYPESSYRCGPLALHRIMLAAHPEDPKSELVDASESTQRGCSLRQVAELSRNLGLGYQMAFRNPGAEFILPAVVHFSVDHFAALLRREDGRYLVEDPTFRNDAWVTRGALEAEASGYFLVPAGQLPEGWRYVERAEAEEVWGRGNVPDPADPPGDCDPTTDPCNPCPAGMATARVHLLNASLNISDEPVGYSPPVGPDVRFMVRYNQRDIQYISNINYSNFGRQWTFDWLAFILDSPRNPLASVTYYMMGGGNRTFSGFDEATQSYALQPLDQTKLIRTSPNSYEMISSDGTRKVFGQSDGGTATQRCFLSQLIDPAGNSVKLTYDADMRIVAIRDTIDQETTLEYGHATDSFKITRVTDPFGRSASFGYNSANQLTSITDVIGIVSKFDYADSAGDFITTMTTPYGITRFTTGETDMTTTRWLEILYPDGERERVEFNQTEGLGVPQSDPPASVPTGVATRNEFLSFRNTYHWDRQGCAYAYRDFTKARIYHWLHSTDLRSPIGILESVKEPLESRVWYDYSGQTGGNGSIVVGTTSRPAHIGRVLDDGSTQLWSYDYNEFGNVTKQIDPLGRTITYAYATNGIDLLEVRQTRAGQNALLALMTYASGHLPLTLTDAAGQMWTSTYNDHGQVLSRTDPAGGTATFGYDVNGYLTSVQGPLGASEITTFTYDACGRVRTRTDEGGYKVAFAYDDLDRVVRITYPDETSDQMVYGRLDQTAFIDRTGRRTTFEFDSVRQMIRRTDPLGRTILFEWCKCGALRRLADPLGRTTTWRHDVQGRVVCKEYTNGSQVTYRYEHSTSRLLQRVDEDLQVTQYNYHRDNTVSRISYTNTSVPTPSVDFTYDPNYQRLTLMSDGVGTTRYSYVAITPVPTPGAGRVGTVQGPLPGAVVQYGYDQLGRRVSTEVNGARSTITLDAAGRVASETNALGMFTYAYDGSSTRLTAQIHPNGHRVEYAYANDAGDHLLQRMTTRTAGGPVSEFGYSHDAPRRRLATWSQRTGAQPPDVHELGYDDANQLVAVDVTRNGHSVGNASYVYDPAGNRLTETVDGHIRRFSHNALNELTAANGDSAAPATYDWDAEHRLVSVMSPGRETRFVYDGLGRRVGIREFMDGAEVANRQFLWSESQVCAERRMGAVVKRFFRQGFAVETGADDDAYLYARDHLGSVRALTDVSGAVQARYAYDAFGRRTRIAGDLDADFGFAGMLWIAAAGLNFTLFRAYAPAIGRWLSRDPLPVAEWVVGPNLFAYANNNPVSRRDPLGLSCCDPELRATQKARADYDADVKWGAWKVGAAIAAQAAGCAAGLALTPLGAVIACMAATAVAEGVIASVENLLELDMIKIRDADEALSACQRKGCPPVCA